MKRNYPLLFSLTISLMLIASFYIMYIYWDNMDIAPFIILSLLAIYSLLWVSSSISVGKPRNGDYFDFAQLINRRINLILFHVMLTSIFVTSLVLMVILLVTPEKILSFFIHEPIQLIGYQIISCVCLGGLLGGFVREFRLEILNNQPESDFQYNGKNTWVILYSLISSVVVSLMVFLLLRAGILKSDSIDTFNVYGITGISSVIGFFSDKVIGRLSSIYEMLFSSQARKDESDNTVK